MTKEIRMCLECGEKFRAPTQSPFKTCPECYDEVNVETDDTYEVELTREELMNTRLALINMTKAWEEKGEYRTAQKFRDTLKPYASHD